MTTPPILIPLYPSYIKKEDAKDLIKIQQRYVSIILIGMAIVLGVIQLFISPKLLSMYADFNLPIPLVTQMSSSVSLIAIIVLFVISTILLTQEPDYTELNEKLKKFKEGEMIMSRKIIDTKKELIWLLPIILVVGWMVISIILPIYNLTSTLQ